MRTIVMLEDLQVELMRMLRLVSHAGNTEMRLRTRSRSRGDSTVTSPRTQNQSHVVLQVVLTFSSSQPLLLAGPSMTIAAVAITMTVVTTDAVPVTVVALIVMWLLPRMMQDAVWTAMIITALLLIVEVIVLIRRRVTCRRAHLGRLLKPSLNNRRAYLTRPLMCESHPRVV